MIKLVIEDDEGKTTVVPLIRDEITIGRREGNTIRLTERNVSRRHAKLTRQNGAVLLEDLESYNGTKVNGAKIEQRTNVAEGDRIQIGDYILGLKRDGAAVGDVEDDAKTRELPRVDDDTEITTAQARPGDPLATTGPPRPSAAADLDDVGRLVCVSSNFAGLEVKLDRPLMVVGRTEDNDIVIDHRSISRHHARVIKEESRYTIADLQSANGVRVNGEEYDRIEMRRGDLVDLGHVRLRFVAAGEDFVFSRDATVVDISKLGSSKRSPLWIVLGAVAVLLLGLGLWKFISPPDDIKTAAGGDGIAATPSPAAAPSVAPDQSALLAKIAAALDAEAWKEALGYCDKLTGKSKDDGKARCAKAAKESKAKALYEEAISAERQLKHRLALVLFHRLPRDSAYTRKRDDALEYKQARDKYLARARQKVADLVGKGACAQAAAKAEEVKKVLPDDGGALAAKAKDCSAPTPTVALKTPSDPVRPRARRPRRTRDPPPARPEPKSPPPAAKKPPPPASTGPSDADKQKAADLLKQARQAYTNAQHARAVKLAKSALRLVANNRDALRIAGAAACALKDARQATWAFNRLGPVGRQLLKSACQRNGIILQ